MGVLVGSIEAKQGISGRSRKSFKRRKNRSRNPQLFLWFSEKGRYSWKANTESISWKRKEVEDEEETKERKASYL